jgi:succinate dehydrogenase / fumarate reductase cytochrome b subunit
MTDVREALFIARTSDGRTVRRPLSPHLQIYKPQLTAALSIFHRITGVASSVGALVLVWWLVAAATGDDAFAIVSAVLHSWVGKLALLGWTAALWYHFGNGIRHLFWDVGQGFELPQVHASGRLVLIAAAVLTVVTWIVGLLAL